MLARPGPEGPLPPFPAKMSYLPGNGALQAEIFGKAPEDVAVLFVAIAEALTEEDAADGVAHGCPQQRGRVEGLPCGSGDGDDGRAGSPSPAPP